MKGFNKLLLLLVALVLSVSLVSCSVVNKVTDKFKKDYTVTFDTVGGNAIDAITVKDGSFLEPVTPSRDGYTFDGWYNGEEKWSFDTGEVTENITLTARWTPVVYTITLDLAGGALSEQPTDYTVESEDIALPTPTRAGYTFLGWTYEGASEPQLSVVIAKGSLGNKTFTANWSVNTYDITLSLDGGTIGEYTDSFTIESEDIVIPAPEKTGYNFTGWVSTNGGAPILNLVIEAGTYGDVSYTATWSVDEYAIEYKLNGGTLPEGVTYRYTVESDDITLVAPERAGYTFLGWTYDVATEPQLTVVIAKGSTGNKSFTANWSVNTYNITLELDGGTIGEYTDSFTIESEDIVIPAPEKAGYNFTGWVSTNGGAPILNLVIEAGTYGDVSYTATWSTNEYTIEYILGGGTLPEGTLNKYTVESDDITLVAPERVGYTFLGWTYEGTTEPQLTVVIAKGSLGNKSFTANWSVNTYDITLNLDGGTIGEYTDSFTVESDDVTLPTPTRLGYTFLGWTYEGVSEPQLSVVIANGSTGNKSFTANWSVDTYTLSFLLEGGTAGAEYPTAYTVNSDSITIAVPTKLGYNFLGWVSENDDTPVYDLVIEKGSVGNREYTAVWSATEYRIVYDTMGGTILGGKPTTYTTESGDIYIPAPFRVGYDFIGWTYDNVTTPVKEAYIPSGSTGLKRFTAHWEPIVYSLTLNLNGGTAGGEYPDSYTVLDKVTLERPTREGYTFEGWEESTGYTLFDTIINKGSTGDKTFTAKWKVIEYKIEYDLQGGTFEVDFSDSYNVETGTVILPSPNRPGYAFTGWTADGVDTPTKDLEIEAGSLGNKNFTANWEIIEYKVEISLGDGTTVEVIPTSYTIESDDITIPTPTKRGYTFLGWTYEGVSEPQLTVVIKAGSTGDKLFVANWSLNVYEIDVNLNGGSVENEIPSTYTVESEDIVLPTPTKRGYTFLGWIVNGSAPTLTYTVEKGTIGDITITASWEIVTYYITYEGVDGAINQNPNTYNVLTGDITLNAPTKVGYTFLGWTYEGVSEPQLLVVIPAGTTGNITLTAHFSLNIYEIDVTLNGGSVEGEIPTEYTIISDNISIPNAVKARYTFLGWSVNGAEPSLDIVIAKGTVGNIELVAVFEPIRHSISYEGLEGATNPNPDYYTVETGELTLTAPTKKGYTFLGWTYDDVTSPTLTVVIPADAERDYTLKAHFSLDTYTIEYELSGGTLVGDIPESYTVLSDSISVPNLTKTAYDFLGWSVNGASPVTDLVIEQGTVGNITLVAVFKATEYKIEYDLQGGTFEVDFDEVYTTESGTIVLPNPERPGYDFTGWTTEGVDAPTKGLEIEAGSLGDKSFKAHWSIITYKVEISIGEDCSYDGIIPESYTVESDSFTLPVPTKHGYTFLGWTWGSVTTPVVNVVIETGTTGDMLFKANWTPTKYTITYGDIGNATHVNPEYYTIESSEIIIIAPVRRGYEFLGWVWEGVTEPQMTYTIPAGSTGDVVLTAKWNVLLANIKYLNTKGASHSNPTTYIAGEMDITLQSLTATGYTFLGWFDQNGNKVTVITSDYSGDLILTAKWNSTVSGTSGIQYTLNADGASYTVTGYTGTSSTVVFPSTYNGLPVTAIANNIGKNNTYARTVIISDGIESIGTYFFYYATNLESVTIGADVKSIGTYSFYYCRYMTTLNFNAVNCASFGYRSYILYSAGTRSTNGISLNIGSDVTRIPDYFTYPDSSSANSYRPKIVSVTFAENSVCEYIGGCAFYYATYLTSIDLPETVTSIGGSAFYSCQQLESITIGENVTYIGNSAFYQCTKLNTVYYNAVNCADIQSASNYIFYNAGASSTNGLTIVIGNKVKRIPNYIFSPYSSSGYAYITAVRFEDGSVLEEIGNHAFRYNNRIQEIILPEGVKTIGEYAFSQCSSITKITLPSALTTVGKYAFDNCRALTSLILPESVTTLGEYAFYNCTALTEVSLGGIETLKTQTFYYCTSLTKLVLPGTLRLIENNAFFNANNIKEVHIRSLEDWFNISFASSSANPMNGGTTLYVDGQPLSELVIPEGVESIGSYAFYGFDFESIVIPASVKVIGDYAFAECSNLKEIKMSGVTAIGLRAFNNCAKLTKAEMPKVESIGSYAFYNCSLLASLTLSDTLTEIGSYAFNNCTELTEISIPASVTTIGSAAFWGCTSLTTVNITDVAAWCAITFGDSNANPLSRSDTRLCLNGELVTNLVIPGSVETVGSYVFLGYNALKSVTIEDGVKYINPSAFQGCKGLVEVDLGNTLVTIGYQAFYLCESLKSVAIPDTTNLIAYYAFAQCKALESVTIGNGVKNIEQRAFSGCSSLKSIVIPDSVYRIYEYAFEDCSALTSITIGKGVTKIESRAFENCYNVKEINFNAAKMNALSSSAYPFYRVGTNTDGVTVNIGAEVTVIPNYLFYTVNNSDYPKITLIKFAEDSALTSIGNYAFYYLKELREINLPESLETIGGYAFAYCISLESVEIPNSVTTIGDRAFIGCESLAEVKLSEGLTSLGQYAFNYCYALTTITLPNSLTAIPNYAFYYCKALTSVTIPEGITSIGQYAFSNCTSLVTIELPSSVTAIGAYIFQDCTVLETVKLGDGITSIPQSAFQGCTSLTSVNLPDMLTNIYVSAFQGCKSLESIVIPSTVTTIGNNAFKDCESLKSVVIPDSVTTIGQYAFQNCTALEEVTIGAGVTTINNYAFQGCTSLKSIVIPDTVTYIGQYAFQGCTALETLTIGTGVKTLGTYAFADCTALTVINYYPASASNLSSSNYVFSRAGAEGEGIVFTFKKTVVSVPAYLLSPASNTTYQYAMNVKSVAFEEGSACTSIGDFAFAYTTGIKSLELPEGVTLGSRLFIYCRDLESFELSDGITSIPNYMFQGCQSLKSVVIPDSVTTIGSYAFENCYGLKSITIGENVTSIGSSAFRNCYGLEEIILNAKTLTVPTSSSYLAFYQAGKDGSGITLTVGENATVIPAYMFYGSSATNAPKITSIVIKDSEVPLSIGKYAFTYNQSLIRFTVSPRISSIGDYAFQNCTRLIEVENLSALTITAGDTTNGYVAYYAKNVYGSDGSSIIINIDGILYYQDPTTSTYYAIGCEDGVKELIFPETVNGSTYEIMANAFSGRTGITKVVFSSGITNIGEYAFFGCTGIKSITLPEQITSIGAYTFYECTGLTELDLGNVVTVGQYAFCGCKSLKTLVIADSVTSVATRSFASCTGLESITLGKGLTSIAKYAFYDCTAVTELVINSTSLPTSFGTVNYIFYGLGQSADGVTVTIGKDLTYIPAYIFCPYGEKGKVPKITNLVFEEGSKCETIGAYAFYMAYIEELTIPEGIKTIGDYAFYKMYTLKKLNFNATAMNDFASGSCVFNYAGVDNGFGVVIGAGVTKIPAYAFYGTNVNYVTFEEGTICESIEAYAFYNATSLISISLPQSVKTIKANAFFNSSLKVIDVESLEQWLSLTFEDISANPLRTGADLYIAGNAIVGTLVIPEGTVEIPAYAFYFQESITDLVIPKSVVKIGDYAFYGCKLTELNINVSHIGADAFASNMLTTLTVGPDVEFIDSYAFGYNLYLEEIYYNAMNATTRSYSQNIFYNAGSKSGGLTLTIGKNVESIPDYLFYTPAGAANFDVIGFEEGSVCHTIGIYAFSGTAIKKLTLPESVKTIKDYAFFECTLLEEVCLSESIESVGYYAFKYCSALKTVDLGGTLTLGSEAFSFCTNLTSFTANSLRQIGDLAFNNCEALTEIVIPESVEHIGEYAFQNCMALTKVTIGKSVKKLGKLVFYGCSALTEIYYNAIECDAPGSDYTPFAGCGASDGFVIVIGKDVTVIPNYLFYAYNRTSSVTSIVFESGSVCTHIGAYAFAYLTGITEITIPGSVETIDHSAFNMCTSLNSVTLSEGVKSIGSSAFAGCTALTEVSLPDTLTYVDSYIFDNCEALSFNVWGGVNYLGNDSNPYVYAHSLADTSIVDIVIHPDTKIIAAYSFMNNSLNSVVIGDSVIYIGYEAFYNCSIKSLTLGKSVERIGYRAFSYSNFTELEIGASVKIIDNYAFSNCGSLTKLTLGANIETIGDSAFENCYALTELNYNVRSILNPGYNCQSIFANAGANGTGIKLTIGNSVEQIPTYLFYSTNASIKISELVFEEGSICTEIGAKAFYGCTSIKSVALPDSLVYIGNDAFYGCTGFTAVTMGDNVISIGDGAFYGCTALETIEMSDALTKIGGNAFYNCSSLKSIVIPDGVTSLPAGLFYGCSSLESMTLPFVGHALNTTQTGNEYRHFGYIFGESSFTNTTSVSLTKQNYYGSSTSFYFYVPYSLRSLTITGGELPENSLRGLYMLTDVSLGNSITAIAKDAFRGCTGIVNLYYNVPSVEEIEDSPFYASSANQQMHVIIGKDVKVIPSGLFLGFTSLASITFEEGCELERIGDSAFAYSSLTEINLPETLTSIGAGAFTSTPITTIVIPENVTSIGDGAFQNCTTLTSVVIPNKVTTIGNYSFYGCSALNSVMMGSGVTSIGDYAFQNCSSLTTIQLSSALESIGMYAFANTSLTAVEIPDGVRAVGMYAFAECSALTTVKLSASLEVISEHTFYRCTALTNVAIPDGVTSVELSAFSGCSSLTAVTGCAGLKTIGNNAFENCTVLARVDLLEGLESIGENAFTNCKALGDVIIPDSVTTIGIFAFSYSGVDSVTIGSGITTIGSYVFYNSDIQSVTIPSGVTNIGYYAFGYCKSLKAVVLPEGLQVIGERAFDECYALESINIPSTVTTINSSAFYSCTSLTSDIVLPAGLKTFGTYAFYSCTRLTSVTISDGISVIPTGAFQNCRNLIEVVIPDSVTTINYQAFRDCVALTKVTIGRGVDYIGSNAFTGCTALNCAIFLDPSNYDTDVEWHAGGTTYHFYISPSKFADYALIAGMLTDTSDEPAWVKTTP